jgi:hypothetical protein
MSPAEIDAFLKAGKLAFVAFRDANGALSAAPFRYRGDSRRVTLEGGRAVAAGQRAIAIVDEYLAYDGIKGALLRGSLSADGEDASLAIDRLSGFDFAKARS